MGGDLFAQDSTNGARFELPFPSGNKVLSKQYADSILLAKWKMTLRGADSFSKQAINQNRQIGVIKYPAIGRPWLHVDGASVNYQYNYRSGMDTPIVEKSIGQHLISGTMDLTIAKSIPIRVYYFERQSNSSYFKDFRDVKIELNTYQYQRLKQNAFRGHLATIAQKLIDPFTKYARDASLKSFEDSKSWLNYSNNRKKLIDAKELVMASDMLDSIPGVNRDSILQSAKSFIALYEKVKHQNEVYHDLYDSLDHAYVLAKKRIQQFNQLSNGNLGDAKNREDIEKFAKQHGIYDKELSRMSDRLFAIRTFAIGRTMPNQSNLTLKNTNVKGIDFAYNKNNLILAVAAGSIDFRIRDFVYNGQRRLPQYVYSVKTGYGRLEGNNLVVTYYEGKKQLYTGMGISSSQPIKGVSISTQFLLGKNLRFGAEVAQSAAQSAYVPSAGKPVFDMKDKNSSAYFFQVKGYFPNTGTRFDGFYQHMGINFQSFTNYRVNAASDSWAVKGEQNLWKRQIQIVAALKKNDYSNPLVLQRYEANTIFKNLSVSFRRRHWPSITLGYMPSSQLTIVDSMVYESHYQVLNASSTYQYKIGTAASTTSVAVNRFFNHAQDTGFLYYNSTNLFFSQSLKFLFFSTVLNATHTDNGIYKLDIWDEGIYFNLFKPALIGFGVKVFHLNVEPSSEVGYYLNGRWDLKRMGQVNFWLERSYLPNMSHGLNKNELYNIGYTKYFNFK